MVPWIRPLNRFSHADVFSRFPVVDAVYLVEQADAM